MSMNTTNTNRKKIRIFGIVAMVVGIAGMGMGVFSIIYLNLDLGPTGENIYVRFVDLDEGDVLYGDVTIRALIIGSENYTVSLYANNTPIGSSLPLIWDSATVADGWWNLRIEIQDFGSDWSATDTVLIRIEQLTPTPGVTVSDLTTIFSEDSGKGNFTVVLDSHPDGNVVINVSSSDISGAIVDNAISGILTLIFTPNEWNTAQTINLTGVNDDINDGDQILDIVLLMDAGLTTDTTGYDAIDPEDVSVTVIRRV
jgi:hypothetical protein